MQRSPRRPAALLPESDSAAPSPSPGRGALPPSELRARLPRLGLDALPRGGLLDDARWERHHRLLRWVLGLHLPVLAWAAGSPHLRAQRLLAAQEGGPEAALTGRLVQLLGPAGAGIAGALPELALLAVPAALLLLGRNLRSRLARSLAVALGLSLSSVLLVVLSGGLTEAHFHHFVVLGFVSLYQDWRPFLTAVGVVLASHALAAVLADAAGVASPAWPFSPWAWVGLHAAFLTLAAAGQVALWRFSESEHVRAERYHTELYGTERALMARLHEAERAKRELLALASHELRTPLTGIIGSARTLDRRLEDLDTNQVRTLLSHVDLHARRLTRLVDNLVASGGAEVDVNATTDLGAVVTTMVRASGDLPGADGHPVRLQVAGPSVAMIDERAARRVVANLLDNAFKFAEPGTEVTVTVRRDGEQVLVEVENIGPPVPEEVRRRLGEPFAQGDSSDARRAEGMGLGLHVVRSLVRPYDGTLELSEDDGRVRFGVRLHAGDSRPQDVTTVA